MTQVKLTPEDIEAISAQRRKEEQQLNLWQTDLDKIRAEAERMFRRVAEGRARRVGLAALRKEIQESCPYIAETSSALLDIAVKDPDVARSRTMLDGILARIEQAREDAGRGEVDKGKYRESVERYILGDKLAQMAPDTARLG
jgi:hypothetical protein